ncbi:class I SAM-dependent methyltransferase [Microvirga subterranea]|uniref:Methyltransferase family protein n=1 Tax=Microvirga subterranea TaxID=186651 RepID=A0A370HLE4_9HYPH|nr:class I SAM-dependent methyltransferase [Microvirga subterranea]RDI59338.1 methyltransferase family protein [Microvirga subterranea]
MRTLERRLRFGLSTLFGIKPLGFFIPYRYAAGVEPVDYPALRPLFDAARPQFRQIVDSAEAYAEDLGRIRDGQGPARFDQDWFPRLDAVAAYTIVRRERPGRIIEVGSGHSTRFMAQAVRDGGLETRIACIDPAPRADLARLDVEHYPVLLKDADPKLFEQLGAGDVLFIDSSHIAMPGTDVDRLFLDVLPRLGAGALVHIHDITLPDAYPAAWSWRAYNEQIPVGTLLQGGAYDLVFASHFVAKEVLPLCSASIIASLPLAAGAHETSLWLRKRAER